MAHVPIHIPSDQWLRQIFASTEARKGGVVKRQIRDVERYVGREAFVLALEERGYQAIENGRHYVIFCNAYPIKRVR
ncbi:MAG: N-(5'-phosphoribosyl)anthranilate isomerase [Pelagimonas sp.]|jgi:hypothetical protein|nr:N-(5'-phosphoribosyl)anthranilate isomerase [Pelagimonas sp.]